MLSHRTLYLHALSVAAYLCDPEPRVDLHTIPLFHANGWGRPQAATMIGAEAGDGAPLRARRRVLRLIQEERATDMSLVPTMANALLNAPDCAELRPLQPARHHDRRRGLVARTDRSAWRRPSAAASMAGYGLTETSPVAHLRAAQAHRRYAERRRRTPAAARPWPAGRSRASRSAWWTCDMQRRAARQAVHRRSGRARRPRHGRLLSGARGHRRRDDATAGCTPATWRCGTKRATSTSSTARRTSSSAAARTSRPSKWRRRSSRIPPCYECAVVAAPDAKWGEVPAALSSSASRAATHRGGAARLPLRRLGKFKAAAHHRIQRRAAPQDRHRQDPQDDPARTVLGLRKTSAPVASEDNSPGEEELAKLRPYSKEWGAVRDAIDRAADAKLKKKLIICRDCMPPEPDDQTGSIAPKPPAGGYLSFRQ